MTADPQTTAATVIGLQAAPGSRLPMKPLASATIETQAGLVGDRYHGSRHRQLSLISLAELAEAEAIVGHGIDPALTRRNLTLDGGFFNRKSGSRIRIGDIDLEVVRDAAPCRLMDEIFGPGVRRALHKRGGVICRVLAGGEVRLGDTATGLLEERPWPA